MPSAGFWILIIIYIINYSLIALICYYIYCLHGHNSTVWVQYNFWSELINAYLPDTCVGENIEQLPVQQINLEGSLQSLPTLLAAKNRKFGQDSALCLGSISWIWWFDSPWFDGNVRRFSEGRTCSCVLFLFVGWVVKIVGMQGNKHHKPTSGRYFLEFLFSLNALCLKRSDLKALFLALSKKST